MKIQTDSNLNKLPRRQVLHWTLISALYSSMWASGCHIKTSVLTSEVSRKKATMKHFMGLSKALTGASSLDRSWAEPYYTELMRASPKRIVDNILQYYINWQEGARTVDKKSMIKFLLSDKEMGPVARGLSKMWLLGSIKRSETVVELAPGELHRQCIWQSIGVNPPSYPVGQIWSRAIG